MRNLIMISLVCFITTLAAVACFGQCNPDPFKPDLRPSCPYSIVDDTKAGAAAAGSKEHAAELNAGIHSVDSTRRNFWRLYPNKPGYQAAELVFLNTLSQKDVYYLMFTLLGGMNDSFAHLANLIGLLDGSVAPADFDGYPRGVDRGIPPYAFPLFEGWVTALRRTEGRGQDGDLASPLIWAAALVDRSNWRQAYVDARNWSEFISSGLDISQYVKPEVYIQKQMEADVSLVMARSKPADLPDPTQAAGALYDQFVKMFGKADVLAAADTVLHRPKNSIGGLAERADIAVGTYIQEPSPNPYLLFLTLLTNSSPRNYAMALCIDQSGTLGGQAVVTFFSQDKWAQAFSTYNQISAKYGEANVIAAAGRLKNAERTSEGGLRADPESKSMVFWFQALLKDPKAVIPDAQLAHFRASSYDPHWLGKIVEVRGTVSRVDLVKGFPPYATIHFKESSGDAIVGYTPNSEMLQASYGDNFPNLVGKPIEIWGQVGEWREGAGVRILSPDQVKVLDTANGLGTNFTDSRPEWLKAPPPVANLVDSPQYLAWKKFPAGTTVAYENRLLSESEPGSNQYTRNKISQDTFRLESIDDKRAVVVVNSTVWHNGQPTASPETRLTYPATTAPGQSPAAAPNESGQETLQISGKKFATHWQSIWSRHTTVDTAPDPQTFHKTWTSEDVPGGLVLSHSQEYTEIAGKPYRHITETILVPVPNVVPELGSSQANPSVPASQPVASQPVRAPAVPQNQPQANPKTPPPAVTPSTPGGAPGASSLASELNQRYTTDLARFDKDIDDVGQYAARTRSRLPVDIVIARSRLENLIGAYVGSIRRGDYDRAEQDLQNAEATAPTLEKFLGR